MIIFCKDEANKKKKRESIEHEYLQAISAKGGHFLEAPVSGSKQPAETGQLVILSAGEKVRFNAPLCLALQIDRKSVV